MKPTGRLKCQPLRQRKKTLLRSLLNLRPPQPASREFLSVQNDYLKAEIKEKGITSLGSLAPIRPGIYLWQGDITTLDCDAIVNAANSQMLGCFCPCHGCIDNAIHTFAGVQLRQKCAALMQSQGHEEAPGHAKITPAYNLPSKYILHTVGPFVHQKPTLQDCSLLAGCYRSCLELAAQNHLQSLAFCCISTGEFHFPNRLAAQIAIQTVQHFKQQNNSEIKVIFNVFKSADYELYHRPLSQTQTASKQN